MTDDKIPSEAWTPCRDPKPLGVLYEDLTADDWFLDKGDEHRVPDWRRRHRLAKQACWDCPTRLRMICLQGALDRDEQFGIWGSYTAEERREFKR